MSQRLKQTSDGDALARLVDAALDEKFGYGLSIKVRGDTSFGAEACRNTAAYIVVCMLQLPPESLDEPEALEACADAAHQGWSHAAFTVWDSKKYGRPQHVPPRRIPNSKGAFARDNFATEEQYGHYARRLALAMTPYKDLTEDEKTKDRVAAGSVLEQHRFILSLHGGAAKTD